MAAGKLDGDWGFAENLAYASLISEGVKLRLVGQDSGRGTFFHRHAVLHDQETGETLMPLHALVDNPERVTIIDSLLSEEAVMAFEYGLFEEALEIIKEDNGFYADTEMNCEDWQAQNPLSSRSEEH